MAFAAQFLLDFAVVEPRVAAGHDDDRVLTDAQCQRLGHLSGQDFPLTRNVFGRMRFRQLDDLELRRVRARYWRMISGVIEILLTSVGTRRLKGLNDKM